MHVLPRALGLVERPVGTFRQRLRVLAVVGIDANARAGADADRVTLDDEGYRQRCDDLERHRGRVFGAADVPEQQDELVAARARHGVLLAHQCHEALRHLTEQRIPDAMPARVIQPFETVQVQIHHGERARVSTRMRQGHRHPVGEQTPIREPRQRVVECQRLQKLALVTGGLMEEADFEQIVNAHQHFGRIEGFADEVLGSRLQRPQLVRRIRSHDQHREVVVRLDRLEAVHHREAVHTRHLQVEDNQVVAVLAMQGADGTRVRRRGDALKPRAAQHPREDEDVGGLIVHDQDAALQDINFGLHGNRTASVVPIGAIRYRVAWPWRCTP